jgi:nitrogen regulatory protein PII
MSLLHEAISEKKFDVRMLEKNLVRNVVSDKEVKTFIDQLPDDAENANFISLEEVAEQKK